MTPLIQRFICLDHLHKAHEELERKCGGQTCGPDEATMSMIRLVATAAAGEIGAAPKMAPSSASVAMRARASQEVAPAEVTTAPEEPI
jgi:hypothetical protein